MTIGFKGSPVYREYQISLTEHIENVVMACRELNVPEDQYLVHDASKWSEEEFEGYARQFHGAGEFPPDADMFARAWLHHIHHNPHHWQHWIFPDGFSPTGSSVINGLVPMPDHYIFEMVADWMGSSMTYTGSWDMTKWLEKNIPKIRVHPQTAEILYEILEASDFGRILSSLQIRNPQSAIRNRDVPPNLPSDKGRNISAVMSDLSFRTK